MFVSHDAEKRQKEPMNWQIESITRTDLACFFVWTGNGFARDALCADHPNLQKRCATIRFWSGVPRP
jgi:hypothetical protein